MTESATADVDVAVIGGGPGGAAAAIVAAEAGLKVLVLESSSFPRLRPGETLHPGAEPMLARLGLDAQSIAEAGYLRHAGIWIDRAGRRSFEPYGRDHRGAWLGLQAPREDLDARLLSRARAAGATIWQPCRAREASCTGARQYELLTDRGRVRARWIVDAGGGRHWLARRWSIPIRRRSRPLIARYGYANGRCAAIDDAPLFTVGRNGWTWTARIGADRYQWTRLHLGGRASDRIAPSPALSALFPEDRGRAENVTWRQAERFAGDGFFLVGDAAGVLDPAASKGVLRALMSGALAGHLAARVRDGHASTLDAANHYDRWLREWFEADIARLSAWYDELGHDLRIASFEDGREAPHPPATSLSAESTVHDTRGSHPRHPREPGARGSASSPLEDVPGDQVQSDAR